MSQPRVDIVIPAYNEGSFIGECLESILRQTYQNWRVVVVDNCSTDQTGAVADSFAARDSRVQVMHCTEFVDQCGNYNRALGQASPEAKYIKLLESDNWLVPEALARCVDLAEQDPTIGIVASYWFRGPRVEGSGLGPGRAVATGREAFDMFFVRRLYIFGTPTTLLFRAEAVREQPQWFRPGIFYDDVEFCTRVLSAWKLGFVHQVLSFVRDDNGGYFSKVRKMDHEPAFRYFLLREHGAKYFNDHELAALNRVAKQEYFGRMGYSLWVVRRGSSYWKFHYTLFRNNGAELRRRDLVWPFVRYLFRPIGRGFEKLSRLLRGKDATLVPVSVAG
jgi:glycosyltransferase involved in cell wall biosynthesis